VRRLVKAAGAASRNGIPSAATTATAAWTAQRRVYRDLPMIKEAFWNAKNGAERATP
jgi:hypothetical protein